MCEVGVLKEITSSEWGHPTFIIPKKNNGIRWITDLRELNKRLKRKPYPLPIIHDLMLNLEGFTYASAIDLNMGYYHIMLSCKARQMCTIVMPWGKYKYLHLPQGLANSPDIFQGEMNKLFKDLEFVQCYLDDLLVFFKGDFDDHLIKLEKVFKKLRFAGLQVNAPKSFFGRQECNYLGYVISRTGIRPQPKKVDAILRLEPPSNKRELRC